MGDPIKTSRQYSRPRKPWDSIRLEAERKIKKTYGIKTKRELWRTEGILRKKRQSARKLLAMTPEKAQKSQKELVGSLSRIGILQQNAVLDDVLGLELTELLERRLQTMVLRKGLANTAKQARQFIVHGHIGVNGRKVTAPSYIVKIGDMLAYFGTPMVLQTTPKKELKKEDFVPAEETAAEPEAGTIVEDQATVTPEELEGE